jgi:methyl-accepting chemotaxis protein
MSLSSLFSSGGGSGNNEAELQRCIELCKQIDQGNFEARIIDITATGTIGELQHALNDMVDRTDAYVRESQACLEYVAKNQYFRTIVEKGMTGSFLLGARAINNANGAIAAKVTTFKAVIENFERNMKTAVQSVSAAATELQSSAQVMENTASTTSEQATAVAAAAEEASTNVQTVAAAAEELSSSIGEITRQVTQSTQVAANAVNEADRANQMVQGLVESSQKIGEVVALITDIAEQTNLLALNATIEAARAGDAGKGFAVVASEVKNLANQTAKATEEIGTQIGGIQTATGDAVEAIKSIGGTIDEISSISSTIAAAVEEQSAATQEIARNVEQASAGTSEVTSNISGVTVAAGETGHAAGEVLSAANELSQQGELLGKEMDAFLVEVGKVI